jgi:acyl carrier protein
MAERQTACFFRIPGSLCYRSKNGPSLTFGIDPSLAHDHQETVTMDVYEYVRSRIGQLVPEAAAATCELSADTILAEIGIDSVRLLTLISSLRQQYAIEMRLIVERGLPTTIGGLCSLFSAAPPVLAE